ncbi:MAG: energy transducer TonB [Blastocatellia bacterium]
MFDTLVESSKQKGGRTGSFFLWTMLVYAAVLLTAGVVTIFWFNPSLTDSAELTALLAPPPPPPPPPPPAEQPKVQIKIVETPKTFTPPVKPPDKIPPANQVKSQPVAPVVSSGGVPGGTGVPGGVAGSVGKVDDDPPPPPPKPSPTAKPEPTPTPIPKKIPVSGGVLQGNAIRRVQPTYPPIAKAARAAGAVNVQVEISEDGDVISAAVVSGHPLLRDAALQAARQWKFKPTLLSGQAVKVSGVLTFNFTLQ